MVCLTHKILDRSYTAALSEKLRKYQGYLAKGIVSPSDGYVVAINANKIPHAYFGSRLPYHVQAFLPFGPPTVAINPRTHQKIDEYEFERASANMAQDLMTCMTYYNWWALAE